MNRRTFLKTAGLAAAALATRPAAIGAAGAETRRAQTGDTRRARAAAAQGSAAGKPNILLIIADDQTWRDSGCYGHPDVKTPNIDRLAAQGMRFTHCFTATAMCAPTRQQLYTGLFPVRNGAFPNHSRVYDGTRSMVHHLGALGYRVGLCGKKHFGPRDSFPFENVGPKKIPDFLRRDADEPFCLVYCSNSPHLPWKEGDASAYDPARLTLPPYLVDTPETRHALCRYYAEVTDFDREVGECMQHVADAGAERDTIFLYTSEQGAQFPHGKWTCYDVGLRTALVVRWPGKVKPGSTTDAMVQYVDVVPTLIEAAGGDPARIDTGRPDAQGDAGFDGRSFLGVLLGRTDRHRSAVFGAHTTRGIIVGSDCYPVRSVRDARYKYIRNLNHETAFHNTLIQHDKTYWPSWVEKAKTDPHARKLVEMYQHRPAEELYDVEKDPWELENRAGDPALADVQATLRRRLDAWMDQQGDRGNATEMQARERQGKGKKKNAKKKAGS
jgi:uncharacterized sulfatase